MVDDIKQIFVGNLEYLFFKKMGQSRPLFCLISSFPHYSFNNTNWKSIDGVLGIRTCNRMMVGIDNTMELWRPPKFYNINCRADWQERFFSNERTNEAAVRSARIGKCRNAIIWQSNPFLTGKEYCWTQNYISSRARIVPFKSTYFTYLLETEISSRNTNYWNVSICKFLQTRDLEY